MTYRPLFPGWTTQQRNQLSKPGESIVSSPTDGRGVGTGGGLRVELPDTACREEGVLAPRTQSSGTPVPKIVGICEMNGAKAKRISSAGCFKTVFVNVSAGTAVAFAALRRNLFKISSVAH